MRSIELFSGAGGLALGLARAGFEHEFMVEWNRAACETLHENKRRGIIHVRDWSVVNADARAIDYSDFSRRNIDLVAGGPPCQPFSIGGKHRGPSDDRDMWPEAIRAVRELHPKAFLFENVRGLLRDAFASYLRYLQLHLEWPELVRRRNENWRGHFMRLERAAGVRRLQTSLHYRVIIQPINAADYGAPQARRRVFIIGLRDDLEVDWQFPAPTHSREALLWDQWVTGDYWEKHQITRGRRPKLLDRDKMLVERLRTSSIAPQTEAWVTTRDAIADLPRPTTRESAPNHRVQPGARSYPGHTGSTLDGPAKALKAGDHGVPGGENMLALPSGQVRYFTVREAARLQGFPDDFIFPVSWTESMRQIGNAVPVRLAETIAGSLIESLQKNLRASRRARRAA